MKKIISTALGGLAGLALAGSLYANEPASSSAKTEFYVGHGGYQENQVIYFQPRIDETENCGWRSYSGSKTEAKPAMKLSKIDEFENSGVRIDYHIPKGQNQKDMWQGIYFVFESYDCTGAYKGYDDLSRFDGLEFLMRGNGKVRLQLTEGYEGCIWFGEIFQKIVEPSEKWKEYRIPFSEFKKRPDFQHSEEDLQRIAGVSHGAYLYKEKFNNRLDTDQIHSTELEMLLKDINGNKKSSTKRDQSSKVMDFIHSVQRRISNTAPQTKVRVVKSAAQGNYIEIKNIGFYKE